MSILADPIVNQPSDWTVSLSMTVDTRVHLTATSNKAITTGSGYAIEIHDLAAKADSSRIALCNLSSYGTACQFATTPEFTGTRYIAVVSYGNTTRALPTSVMAVSQALIPPPWTISMAPTVTATISFTATTNYALDLPARYLNIYDTATGKAAAGNSNWCSSGTICTRGSVAPKKANSSYVAYVSSYPSLGAPTCCVLAATPAFSPPPWTVTLTGSGSSLTASGNYAIDNTGNFFEIFDLNDSWKTANYVGWCSSGTSCTLTTSSPGHQFIASVGTLANKFPPDPMLAVSNQIGLQGPTAPYETAGGSNPAELNQCFSCAGDPVNTLTGEFFETNTDILIPTRGPALEAQRTYSSQRAALNGAFGFGWTSPYSMALSTQADGTATIRQENGSQVTFTSTGSGYTAPPRVIASLTANADGSWTYIRRGKDIFTFTPSGRLLSVADLNGTTVTLAYDNQGRLSAATEPAGRALTFTYGADGRISAITDPANRVASYSYDAAGRLQAVTLPGNRTTSYTYDAANLITSITDPRGHTTTNTYDQARRVTKQTTAAGDLTLAYTATSTDALTTIISPGGRVTKENYRAGQLVSRIEGAGTPQQGTWTYGYDPATLARTTVTDPIGRTTSAAYDTRGNMLSTTDAAGGRATATYDVAGNMLTSTDAAGTTTTFTYGAAGNRLTTSRPLSGSAQSAVVSTAYGDPAHSGDATVVTDPNGHATSFSYDVYGNRTAVTDALGRTTTTAYDILGRKTAVTTPSGKTTTFSYTPSGFLATVTDPLGKTTAYGYDPDGNKTSVTDRMGRTTAYAYDVLGRNTSTTAPDGTVSASEYDNDGNLTSQTDQAAHVTNYSYDARNRLTSSTDGLSRATTYAYDAAGQLTGKTDPSGRITTLSYNAAGDKTGISYSDGVTPNETFTYTALHQAKTMTDGTGTTTTGYDSLGRVTSRTNGAGKTVGYTYDLAGNITAQTYPNGQSVTRAYDAANNLTSLTDWLNNSTTFTTNTDGQPAATQYANGVTATTTYDAAGLPTAITNTATAATLAAFNYTRNDVGNLAISSTTGVGQAYATYSYTGRDELASVNSSGYSYDPAGNPTTLGTGAALTYDAANQPTQVTRDTTVTPITHDNQGNRLSGPAPTGTATYTWNQASRLVNANGTTFTYDGLGLRASRTPAAGPAQTYTWDATRSAPLVLSDGSTHYLYDGVGNPVEQIDTSGNVLFYQHDQYGSTRLLTDGAGNVSATFAFDPNGNLTGKTGTADTALRWNGQSQDADTGLYYLRARYYDPITAQFMSVDPLASTTRAVYTYADNNPLNKDDALGLYASPLNGLDGGGAATSTNCVAGVTTTAIPVNSSRNEITGWCGSYNACSNPTPEGCYSFNACGASPAASPRLRCVYDHIGAGAVMGAVAGAGRAGAARYIPILGQGTAAGLILGGAFGGTISGALHGLNYCPQ